MEQNALLGGGASTFQVKGIDFDIGTYFLGEVEWMDHDLQSGISILRTCYDQLTDGQVEFAPYDNRQDTIYIGRENRRYEIHGGIEWKTFLKKQFPEEHSAIDKYIELVEGAGWKFNRIF